MQADLNWFAVLAHHAIRTPDQAMPSSRETRRRTGRWRATPPLWPPDSHERGVGAGDVVGLLSYNCPEFLETIFAANYLGAIAMPINWRLAAPEVRYILEHSQARALVCDEALVDLGDEATEAWSDGLGARSASAPAPAGWIALADRAPRPHGDAAGARSRRDDVHRLMYTSGTTGRPKGVMLTHANLAWKNLAHLVEFGFTSADLGLACGPLYHVGALDLTTTSLIAAGATTIIHRGVRRRRTSSTRSSGRG